MLKQSATRILEPPTRENVISLRRDRIIGSLSIISIVIHDGVTENYRKVCQNRAESVFTHAVVEKT